MTQQGIREVRLSNTVNQELLETLKDVVAAWNDRHLLTEVALKRHYVRAEAAIAKATKG